MHEAEIDTHANNLVRVKQFFSGPNVWPDQCDFAIEVFVNLLKPIRSLNQLLDTAATPGSGIPMNRYSLLVQSHYLEQGIRDILSRLKIYKGLCQSGAKNEHPEFQALLADLEDLWRSYRHLSETVDRLIAQAQPRAAYIS